MTRRAWKRIGVAAVAVAVIVAGAWTLLNRRAHARWQQYMDDLAQSGQPLTFSDLDARRPPVTLEATLASYVAAHFDALKAADASSEPWDFFAGVSEDVISRARAVDEHHRTLISGLVDASDRPGRFAQPAGYGLITASIDHLPALRRAALLLRQHAGVQLLDEDVTSACHAAAAQLALADTLDGEPVLLGRLVQVAIQAIAAAQVEYALRVGATDDATLRDLQGRFTRVAAASTPRWALLGERALIIDAHDVLLGGESITDPLGVSPLAERRWVPDFLLLENERMACEVITRLAEATADRTTLLTTAETVAGEVAALSSRHSLIKLMVPAVHRALILDNREAARLACAQALLAAERYRLQAGSLPTSLTDLVPRTLDAVPVDPFSGGPLRLTVVDPGIVIYSIGADGSDDGGQVTAAENDKEPPDVGLRRLWHADHRGVRRASTPASAGE